MSTTAIASTGGTFTPMGELNSISLCARSRAARSPRTRRRSAALRSATSSRQDHPTTRTPSAPRHPSPPRSSRSSQGSRSSRAPSDRPLAPRHRCPPAARSLPSPRGCLRALRTDHECSMRHVRPGSSAPLDTNPSTGPATVAEGGRYLVPPADAELARPDFSVRPVWSGLRLRRHRQRQLRWSIGPALCVPIASYWMANHRTTGHRCQAPMARTPCICWLSLTEDGICWLRRSASTRRRSLVRAQASSIPELAAISREFTGCLFGLSHVCRTPHLLAGLANRFRGRLMRRIFQNTNAPLSR